MLLYVPATQSVHSEAPEDRDRAPERDRKRERDKKSEGDDERKGEISYESVHAVVFSSEDIHLYARIHSTYVYAFQISIGDRFDTIGVKQSSRVLLLLLVLSL